MPPRKSAANPRPVALAALAAVMADPTPRVLFGSATTPGFFKSNSATTRPAAELCVRERWLEETGEKAGSGARAKPLYRVTPQGVQAVLDDSPAVALLEGLITAVKLQEAQLQTVASAMQGLQAGIQQISTLLPEVAAKVKPPDVTQILTQLAASRPSHAEEPTPRESQEWEEEIVRRAALATSEDPLPLPDLHQVLKESWPSLTIGQLHDSLRALRDANQIRLLPYTRAMGTIATDREAMFLDGEVMYYVCRP